MTMLKAEIRLKIGSFSLEAAFDAPLSGVTAMFGPSGAGKSVLLSVLAGLRRLESGRIALAERLLDDVALGVRTPPHRRGVGLVFQHTRLFPHLSVEENLRYAERRAEGLRQLSTLREAATAFDIFQLLQRPVRNLSGGERSRVALARAVLSAPELLLLDEPFAALDGARRAAFLATLRAMHRKFHLPLVVVTHQIDDVAGLADHLIGLRDGNVVVNGPLADAAAATAFRDLLDVHDVGALAPAHAFRGVASERAAHWIRADHVLLAAQEPHGLSARNIWKARVVELIPEQHAQLVRLEAPFGALFSRVTAEAAAELALAPGQSVWAVVKAHAS